MENGIVKRKSVTEGAETEMWGQGRWGEPDPPGRRRDVSSSWENVEESEGWGIRNLSRSGRGGRARGASRGGQGIRATARLFHLSHSLAIGRERGGEGRGEDRRREGTTDRQRREKEERMQRRALRLLTGLEERGGDVSSEDKAVENTRLEKNVTNGSCSGNASMVEFESPRG